MPNPSRAVWTIIVGLSLAAIAPGAADASPSRGANVRLYALDCGRVTFKDLSAFSDTGEYEGRGSTLSVPCFVITHPRGVLVWDTGLGDQFAASPGGIDIDENTHASVSVTLSAQLSTIGLKESDVTHLAFSHLHNDHTGNANHFGKATWILNQRELDWARSSEAVGLTDPATFSGYQTAKKLLITGDHDVFGDGSVRILKTPGHTPGHQVLMLKLARAGTVILSGDLYHTKENERERRVPTFNTSRAETLASFNRVTRIIENKRARLYVQHDPTDFAALPRFPRYLD